MKALVLGGAGFIGSHLIDRLLENYNQVICVDNLHLGTIENLKEAKRHEDFIFIEGDILDTAFINNLFNTFRFDIIYHLAANSDIRAGAADTSLDLDLNFNSTKIILDLMVKHSIDKIFFTSTSAIFGEMNTPIKEDSPINPESLYGASKLAAEGYIKTYCRIYDIKSWIVRLPDVIGDRSTHGVIHDLIRKLDNDKENLEVLGDGNQSKPYLYVKDLVECFLYIMEHTQDNINVFNIGCEDNVSVSTIAELILKYSNEKRKIIYTGGRSGWKGDVPKYELDYTKLKQIGWRENKTLESIHKTLQEIYNAKNFIY